MTDSTFEAICFAPGEQRLLGFRDDSRQIGKAVLVGPADIKAGGITVELEPYGRITGRLLDKLGQPIADARIDASAEAPAAPRASADLDLPSVTDSQGRFHFLFAPGCDYDLNFVKNGYYETDGDPFSIKPGQTRDLGDIHVKYFQPESN